jgi:hypothetical protein
MTPKQQTAEAIEAGETSPFSLDHSQIVDADHRSARNHRNRNPSVRFVDGYAEGWAFLVHEAFRPALDITLSTLIDKDLTEELRLQKLQDRGYSSWYDLKTRVADINEYQSIRTEVFKRKRFIQVWTQGIPPAYDFHEGDTIHSADGMYTVQVNSAGSDGMLAVQVYQKGDDDLMHRCREIFCSQEEFVGILKNGLA